MTERIEGFAKATAQLDFTLQSAFSDCSLGLFRVQEHCRRRIPSIAVDCRQQKQFLSDRLEITLADVKDSREIIGHRLQQPSTQQALNNCLQSLQLSIALRQVIISTRRSSNSGSGNLSRYIISHSIIIALTQYCVQFTDRRRLMS
jgi:hypothetical protein